MAQKIPRSKRIGQVFGRLTVVGVPQARDTIECLCECGTRKVFLHAYNIFNGHTKSCGCLNPEVAVLSNTTHGHSKSHPLYYTWKNMRNRCRNPKVNGYEYYGGKGISICAEWEEFDDFRVWAERNGYKKGLSIDRINPDLDYYPDNCQFITCSENSWRRWHPDQPLSEFRARNKRYAP